MTNLAITSRVLFYIPTLPSHNLSSPSPDPDCAEASVPGSLYMAVPGESSPFSPLPHPLSPRRTLPAAPHRAAPVSRSWLTLPTSSPLKRACIHLSCSNRNPMPSVVLLPRRATLSTLPIERFVSSWQAPGRGQEALGGAQSSPTSPAEPSPHRCPNHGRSRDLRRDPRRAASAASAAHSRRGSRPAQHALLARSVRRAADAARSQPGVPC
jgi:hypothetical protein